MLLLDANMDVHLASVLSGFKISRDTAGKRGWKALSNGDLVGVAVDCSERPPATLAPISRTIPRTMEGTPN